MMLSKANFIFEVLNSFVFLDFIMLTLNKQYSTSLFLYVWKAVYVSIITSEITITFFFFF